MKWLQRSWLRIPRPQRAMFNILVILVLYFLIYYFLGCPPLTEEQEFRRMEKANLVGPGVILDTLDQEEYSNCTFLTVAETENGIIFYAKFALRPPTLSYREKTGDITVLSAPYAPGTAITDACPHLPVYVFDDYLKAVRAELELRVSNPAYPTNNLYGEYPNPVAFDNTYRLEARREADGFFRFDIAVPEVSEDAQYHRYALFYLASICHSTVETDASVPATVRLYDENGELVAERSLIIRSTAFETHTSHTG